MLLFTGPLRNFINITDYLFNWRKWAPVGKYITNASLFHWFSPWAVIKEHLLNITWTQHYNWLVLYEAACPVDLARSSRTVQLMTCDQQTHLSSNHMTNLLDPKPKEFTAFQGNMIFALTVSHSFILKPDKELKFHLHSPFLGSSPLMEGDHWESIPRPRGVRGRNQTYKSHSLWASGKIPSHHCPELQSHVAPPAPMLAQVLSPSIVCFWEVGEESEGKGKRHRREGASDACPEH